MEWTKSSYSAYNGSCVEWKVSSHSGSNGHCVKVAGTVGSVLVRDSKNPEGPVLAFTPAQWRMFLRSLGR